MPDRALLKQEAKGILRGARVSPYLFTLVVLVISFVIGRVSDYVQWDTATRAAYEARLGIDLSFLPFCHAPFPGAVTLFVAILCSLLSVILSAGVILYHLGIRRGEARPIETLFDGFFFAGKIILLYIVMAIFITLCRCCCSSPASSRPTATASRGITSVKTRRWASWRRST